MKESLLEYSESGEARFFLYEGRKKQYVYGPVALILQNGVVAIMRS